MKKLVAIVMLIFFIVGVFSVGWCDEVSTESQSADTQSQKDVEHDIETMSKQMTPMFGNMVESMMQGKLKVFAQAETTILLAKFVKNFYDNLIREGFSKEEALQIVTSFGFPAIQ